MAMTVFFQTKMDRDDQTDGGIYARALFYSVATIMFNGISEIGLTIQKLPIFYKQRDFFFFPSWAYALPAWILQSLLPFLKQPCGWYSLAMKLDLILILEGRNNNAIHWMPVSLQYKIIYWVSIRVHIADSSNSTCCSY